MLDLASISADEADTLGTPFDEFVLECAFDRVDCTNSTYFRALYNRRYGRCHTFSSGACE